MNFKKLKQELTFARLLFLSMLLVYLALALVDFNIFYKVLLFFWKILVKIVPILVLIFILMLLVNYFVSPKTIIKHFHKGRAWKGWLIMVLGGILSAGAIYMWYPLLADLKKKGVKQGFIATFLYNRAIKIPLMPLFLIYFDLKMLVILTCVMIVFSIFEGLLINFLEDEKVI